MVTRTKWLDRKFNFDYPVGWMPCIIERLRGTPARIEEIVKALPVEIVKIKPVNGGWCIQEHVAHLIMVETLHDGRLDDFAAGKEILRPADRSKATVSEADFLEKELDEVLAMFRKVRAAFVRRLEAFDDESAAQAAHHPRLDVPMRVVDNACFAAEHDDFHVSYITELTRELG